MFYECTSNSQEQENDVPSAGPCTDEPVNSKPLLSQLCFYHFLSRTVDGPYPAKSYPTLENTISAQSKS